jgi:hypothetical protein
VPKSVATVASGLKKGRTWVLSASGGVMVQPWQFAAATRDDAALAGARDSAIAGRPETGWRW